MKRQPFLRAFVTPAALCAVGLLAVLATVLQYSLRAYVPGSLEAGGFTLANFTALLKPLYGRVFLETVWICFLTAFFTLLLSYPIAYALVHTHNRALKGAILVIAVTPLFLGEVVRTYSWIIVLGNNGFLNAMLLWAGVIERPLQIMFTTFAVVVALVHVTLPVMVIMLAAALAHIDPNYKKAAHSLGAGPVARLLHRDASVVCAGHHSRSCHRVCLDIQRVCHPATDRRREGQYGLQPRLSAGAGEL